MIVDILDIMCKDRQRRRCQLMSDLLFAVTQHRVLAGALPQASNWHSGFFLRFMRPLRSPSRLLSGYRVPARLPGASSRIATQQPEQKRGHDREKLVDPENQALVTALLQRGAAPLTNNMMSAIETGTSVYQPAQLLNWVYMSLQDAQGGAFDAFKAESDASPRDVNISKRSAADLSSNYLNNFFHLRGEVGFKTYCI